MKHVPKRGEVIVVPRVPACDFCQDGTAGPYDFATLMGPWANGCETHWRQYRRSPGLGAGSGQLWITEDQVQHDVPVRRGAA
jgi:hypothetical protein